MAAQQYPVPTIDVAKFELESRQSAFERFVPAYFRGEPAPEHRSDNLWAVEGLLVPGQAKRALLAVNIGDLIDTDKDKDDPSRIIASGLEIAAMLTAARLGQLSSEFPNISVLNGNEATIVIPHSRVAPIYEAGMKTDPSSNFPQALAEAA